MFDIDLNEPPKYASKTGTAYEYISVLVLKKSKQNTDAKRTNTDVKKNKYRRKKEQILM